MLPIQLQSIYKSYCGKAHRLALWQRPLRLLPGGFESERREVGLSTCGTDLAQRLTYRRCRRLQVVKTLRYFSKAWFAEKLSGFSPF